jgi:hypothetical protein
MATVVFADIVDLTVVTPVGAAINHAKRYGADLSMVSYWKQLFVMRTLSLKRAKKRPKRMRSEHHAGAKLRSVIE